MEISITDVFGTGFWQLHKKAKSFSTKPNPKKAPIILLEEHTFKKNVFFFIMIKNTIIERPLWLCRYWKYVVLMKFLLQTKWNPCKIHAKLFEIILRTFWLQTKWNPCSLNAACQLQNQQIPIQICCCLAGMALSH